MDITRLSLSRLFSTDFGQTRKQAEQVRSVKKEVPLRNEDAVTLSSSFTKPKEPPMETISRAERVETIRTQVQTGTYKQPDSQKLAEAVSRELFVL
jgi:anti-sigma28 factor (negative regulator of flagellin synthesis)